MFTWLENLFTSMSGDVKNVVTIVLWLCAMGFIAKPAISAMKAIGDKKWGEGLAYIGACAGIVIVAVIVTVALLNAGKNTGENINGQASMIYAVPVLTSLVAFKLSSMKQAKVK